MTHTRDQLKPTQITCPSFPSAKLRVIAKVIAETLQPRPSVSPVATTKASQRSYVFKQLRTIASSSQTLLILSDEDDATSVIIGRTVYAITVGHGARTCNLHHGVARRSVDFEHTLSGLPILLAPPRGHRFGDLDRRGCLCPQLCAHACSQVNQGTCLFAHVQPGQSVNSST